MSDPSLPPTDKTSPGDRYRLAIIAVLAILVVILGPCLNVVPETRASYYPQAQPLHARWWREVPQDLPGYLVRRAAWLSSRTREYSGEMDIPAHAGHTCVPGTGLIIALTITRDMLPSTYHAKSFKRATIYVPSIPVNTNVHLRIPEDARMLYSEHGGHARVWETLFGIGFATGGTVFVRPQDGEHLHVELDVPIPLYHGADGQLDQTLRLRKMFTCTIDRRDLRPPPTPWGRNPRTLLKWPLPQREAG